MRTQYTEQLNKAFENSARNDTREPCEYGHLGCSYKRGGPCHDEFLSNNPEFDVNSDVE